LIQIKFSAANVPHPARLQLSGVHMLEFLLVFHSNAIRSSTTAILKADTDDDATHKARAIASHDGRAIELWRNQQMIARFPGQGDALR
jgi:hypothetical protein